MTDTEVVQDTALNGAQVQALVSIVDAVAQGQLPGDSAKAMIEAAFPLLDAAQVSKIVGPAIKFTPEPPAETAKQ